MIYEGPRRARKEEGPEVGRKRAGDFADARRLQSVTSPRLTGISRDPTDHPKCVLYHLFQTLTNNLKVLSRRTKSNPVVRS